MTTILVLGAGGFIGRHVMQAVVAAPWARAVAAERVAQPRRDAAAALSVDATDPAALRSAIAQVKADAVINCVAGPEATLVGSARALAEAVAAERSAGAAPLRVVHLSTMSVYGSATGLLDESAPLRDDLGAYGRAKIAAEHAATTHGNTVMLRPGCVYGGGSPQWTQRVAQWLMARRLGDLGLAGDGYCNLVHVRDVAAAALQAARNESAAGGVFNLGMPEPITWNDYFIQFGKLLGAVPVRRVTPRRLRFETRLLAPPLKIVELLAARLGQRSPLPPPIPPSVVALFGQRIGLRVTAAERVLGMQWMPLDQGLREAAARVLGSAQAGGR